MDELSEADYIRNFRLTRSQARYVHEILLRSWPSAFNGGRRSAAGRKLKLSPWVQLHVTLSKLARNMDNRAVMNAFGLGKDPMIVSRCCSNIIAVLSSPLVVKRFISWAAPDRRINLRDEWEGAIGAIDGVHFAINPPRLHREVFINYKGYPSVLAQAVAAANGTFCHVFCAYPGSVGDKQNLQLSPLWERSYQMFEQYNHYLLGDGGYFALSWLIIPFTEPECNVGGRLELSRRKFNQYHASTRTGLIETAFGRLKIGGVVFSAAYLLIIKLPL